MRVENILKAVTGRVLLAGAAGLLMSASALAAPPKDLDAYVNRALGTFGAPGMAVAIVEDGKPALARGYGVRKLGQPGAVDAHTIFPIGSNTKLFTATALAMLVDDGKLAWTDKVAPRLRGFQMYDPFTTGEMTVTDLLTHRSGLGLGEGDLMMFPETDFTRREIVEHLRYLKPVRGFRSGYDYDNVLYIAAGELVQDVSGMRWEDVIHTRIFKPLGMTDAAADFAEIAPDANRGWPHARTSGLLRGLGPIAPMDHVYQIDAAAAAGSINASATDMTKWLTVQLNHGVSAQGQRLFSEQQSAALWTAQTLMPTAGEPAAGPLGAVQPQFSAYALGLMVRDYKGHRIITHAGGVFGGISEVVLIPDRHVAFAIMTNSEESGALLSVYLRLLDHYLGEPTADYPALMKAAQVKRTTEAEALVRAQTADSGTKAPPSGPLSGFAGVYRDAWYGTITVKDTGQGLRISFDRSKNMEGPLEPVRFDTFRTRFTDRTIEDAYVTFTRAPDGTVDHVKMQKVSPLADFSFDFQDLDFRLEKSR